MLAPSHISPSEQLILDLAELSNDPLKFVMYAFPWGEPGTELADKTGPEPWQTEILLMIRDKLPTYIIQSAIASGHGIGKSAIVSWIILWSLSTFEDTTGVVTANTETQLKTKTWNQLGKWHRLFIARDLFKLTATALYAPDRERTWRIDMVPWSERNTEAFAGLHNLGKRIVLLFDEASAIPDTIWETAEGALTDVETQILWMVFGNPTRNTGRFRSCFSSKRWWTKQVDSREVSFTNKTQIKKWIEDYGEDSDFVRVRVRGIFPRTGALEFISLELVDAAMQREADVHLHDPLVLGVDVARFGDDETVIFVRKGRDGRNIPPTRLRGINTMQVAGKVAELYLNLRADAVFVDGGGVGGGVVDRLRQLQVPVWDIQFGSSADNLGTAVADSGVKYANKRAEMWGSMREWLKGGALISDTELREQLIAPHYGYNAKNQIQLEKKEDIKKRGAPSPDIADALALTFAFPVVPHALAGREGAPPIIVESEYDPLEAARH